MYKKYPTYEKRGMEGTMARLIDSLRLSYLFFLYRRTV